MLVILILFLALSVYLVSFIDIKSKWLQAVYQKHSMLSIERQSQQLNSFFDSFLYQLGVEFAQFLPKQITSNEEFILEFLQKDSKALYLNFAKALLLVSVAFLILIFMKNFFLFFALFLLSFYFVFESRFSYQKAISELDLSVKHIVQCLDILLVKSETPIITALELIAQELDDNYFYTRLELKKIIKQASKTGLSTALRDFYQQNYGPKLKEFFSLLMSVNDGASKKAISEQISNFLDLQIHEAEENQKSAVENLQLYLILPVIVMLLIIMFPMADAIMYSLQSTGFTGGLININ